MANFSEWAEAATSDIQKDSVEFGSTNYTASREDTTVEVKGDESEKPVAKKSTASKKPEAAPHEREQLNDSK